jgi:hypothetical protein
VLQTYPLIPGDLERSTRGLKRPASAVRSRLPRVDRVLGQTYSRTTSSAVRPDSTCFNAACASLCLLLLIYFLPHIFLPHIRNHTCGCATLGSTSTAARLSQMITPVRSRYYCVSLRPARSDVAVQSRCIVIAAKRRTTWQCIRFDGGIGRVINQSTETYLSTFRKTTPCAGTLTVYSFFIEPRSLCCHRSRTLTPPANPRLLSSSVMLFA